MLCEQVGFGSLHLHPWSTSYLKIHNSANASTQRHGQPASMEICENKLILGKSPNKVFKSSLEDILKNAWLKKQL